MRLIGDRAVDSAAKRLAKACGLRCKKHHCRQQQGSKYTSSDSIDHCADPPKNAGSVVLLRARLEGEKLRMSGRSRTHKCLFFLGVATGMENMQGYCHVPPYKGI